MRRQARGSRRGAQVGRRWGAQAGTREDALAAGSRPGQHGRASAGRARARGAGGKPTAEAQQARGERAAWALGARPRRTGWLRAVHSVYSACFRSGLSRHCYYVDFWTLFVNPVHEHCSSQNFF